MGYLLWRQDDNGNAVVIERFGDRDAAEHARAAYEARGHKQIYWVEVAPAASSPPARPPRRA